MEEYALREDYLEWIPKDGGWEPLCLRRASNVKVVIVDPGDEKNKTLFLHQFIIKSAFPFSFFGEERSKEWNRFAIVSDNETSEKFIIPL